MNRRPTGVTVAAILLALASLLLIGMAGLSVFAMVAMGHLSASDIAAAGTPPPPPGFMAGAMGVAVAFYLLLAAWGIGTTVGLFRMMPWARISVMVIGGGMVLLGLFFALGTVAAQVIMKRPDMPVTGDPRALRGILVLTGIFWLAVAAVGVWWLVYFAVRRTREAFAGTAAALPSAGYPGVYPAAAATPMSLSSNDFAFAQPLPPGAATEPTAEPQTALPPENPRL